MSAFFSASSSLRRRLLLGLVLLLGAPVMAHAAEAQLLEHTSDELNKLKPLTDAKQWDAALSLLNGLQAGVPPTSYDFAIVSDIKSKVYMQMNDYTKAMEPMEAAIRLGDTYGYFDEHDIAEKVLLLAQIYYQEAAAIAAKAPATSQQYFGKAAAYVKRWMGSATGKIASDAERQETQLLYASILYYQAVADPKKADSGLLKQAQQQIEAGLLASPHPKETFYILLLATYQQENNNVRAAEILELLVKQYPNKKDYWAQLIATYLNLALDKNEERSRMYNIRAIITTERAQAMGFNKTQKDNFNLVGIYINLGQYGKATELLYAGLKNGTIESTRQNWEYLAYSYQQVDKPYQAIDVLKEAAAQFPKAGQLDFQISQIYYSLDKNDESYRSLVSAVAKGNLEKPAAVYSFLAYIAFEQRRYDEALKAAQHALTYPESAHDTQLPRLKQAIEDAIKERDQAKEVEAEKKTAKSK